jgi:hypothetical protein
MGGCQGSAGFCNLQCIRNGLQKLPGSNRAASFPGNKKAPHNAGLFMV